jgi:hypothetical protein
MPSRTRALLTGAIIIVCTAVLGYSSSASKARSTAAPGQGTSEVRGDYLPLAVGAAWELRATGTAEPMRLEVTGREGEAYVVRWTNPFVPVTFRFVKQGSQVRLTGLDMGRGMGGIPDGTVYWDFGMARGREWQSPVGGGEVTERDVQVQTRAGRYTDAVEIRTIDQQKQSMYWTFAPGVGLVRWGRGRDAYVLSSFRPGSATSATSASDRAAPRSSPAPAPRPGTGTVLIGLDANQNDKTGGGKNGKLAALREALNAGISLLHSAPMWDAFEKNGRYGLDADAAAIGEFAVEHSLPIALNLRVVDTNQRSMPKSYDGWRFDDPRLAERLTAALRAFPDSYKRQTRLLAIGNEVDGYFGSRRGEIAEYAELIRRVKDTARQEFPNARFTVNFTFAAVADMTPYRAITDLTEFASFTYYPLNADFTMRGPRDAAADIARMIDAAAGRPLYIQEIGYASSERLESSPAKQAEFYQTAFGALRAHRDRILGATFLFMSDLSRFVVEYLGVYYRAAHSANFKAYLQTLGIVERSGAAKPAFAVFQREAQALKGTR